MTRERFALGLAVGASAGCLALLGCAASQAQAQVAAITAGCKASLDIARKNRDPREADIAKGCNAQLDVWADDVPDGGAK